MVPGFVIYQNGCTRLPVASDKVYQFAHGRWFSPGTPASSNTKTGCHDIAESGVKHQKINQSNAISDKLALKCIFNYSDTCILFSMRKMLAASIRKGLTTAFEF